MSNPLHDPSKILPTVEPQSPNAPGNRPRETRLPPNTDFPRGWPGNKRGPAQPPKPTNPQD